MTYFQVPDVSSEVFSEVAWSQPLPPSDLFLPGQELHFLCVMLLKQSIFTDKSWNRHLHSKAQTTKLVAEKSVE